ncbi:sulfite exporter TauE/SafE family protein [[Clostridium] aminophilum]|uniref:urease accessory protein UreH domain-containing protein n=1 Tax=[Clostridium] aminophilum TaxID=1526 RepID=UPI003319C0FF
MTNRRKVLTIDGMTCTNCQKRIEQTLIKTDGIMEAHVSFRHGEAEICYRPQIINLSKIERIIEELGYSVIHHKKEKKTVILRNAGILATIGILYVLLQQSGMLNMFVPSRLADSEMGYGMLFVVGMLTSIHCVAMCGGINLAQSIRNTDSSKMILGSLLYNAGRITSYTAIGGVLGFVGMLATGGTGTGIPVLLQGILKLIAGAFMAVMGIRMLDVIPGFRRFQIRLPVTVGLRISRIRQKANGSFVIGLLNGFMPCGPMQSMQIVALGTGNPVAGAMSMLMFSLGTVPLMLGLGSFISTIGKRHSKIVMNTGAVLVVVLGLAMFTQGGSLAGINSIIVGSFAETSGNIKNVAVISEKGDEQIVYSDLDFGGYPEITVYSGIPVKWVISVSEEVINGCNYRMILSEYGISHDFTPGENIIEFMPLNPGTIPYTCWMGMINGQINVIKD